MQNEQRNQLNATLSSQQQTRLLDKPLASTARATPNSKWSINIQEIVKRTQKNLERGTKPPSSLTRAFEEPTQANTAHNFVKTEESAPINLYRDLKQKLSEDSSKQLSLLRPSSAAQNRNLLMKQSLTKVTNKVNHDKSLKEQLYSNQGIQPSVQSGQGGDNLTNLDEEDEADFEAQLLIMGHQRGYSTTLKKSEMGKRLSEIDRRQKIFEDEIIKRIQENQKSAKSMYNQLKKSIQSQADLEENYEKLQTQLIALKTHLNMQNNTSDFQMQIDELHTLMPQQFEKVLNQAADLVTDLKFELQQKLNEVKQTANKQPNFDSKQLENTILARVQSIIFDSQDNSEIFNQIDELRSKIVRLDNGRDPDRLIKDKRTEQDIRALGLKLDKLDIKMDSYKDQISQLDGLNSDRNKFESLCEAMKAELRLSIDETESKLQAKLAQDKKSQQSRIADLESKQDICLKKLNEAKQMLIDVQNNQSTTQADDKITERLEELQVYFDQELKLTKSENYQQLQSLETQLAQKLKKSLTLVQVPLKEVQDKLVVIVQGQKNQVTEDRVLDAMSECEQRLNDKLTESVMNIEHVQVSYEKMFEKQKLVVQSLTSQVGQCERDLQKVKQNNSSQTQEFEQKLVLISEQVQKLNASKPNQIASGEVKYSQSDLAQLKEQMKEIKESNIEMNKLAGQQMKEEVLEIVQELINDVEYKLVTKDMEALKEQIRQLEKKSNDKELEAIKEQVKFLLQRCNDLETLKESLNKKKSNEIETLQDQIKTLQFKCNEIEFLSEQIKTLQPRNMEQDSFNQSFKQLKSNEIEPLKEQIKQLQQKTSGRELDSIREAIKQLQSQFFTIDSMKDQIGVLEEETQEMKSKVYVVLDQKINQVKQEQSQNIQSAVNELHEILLKKINLQAKVQLQEGAVTNTNTQVTTEFVSESYLEQQISELRQLIEDSNYKTYESLENILNGNVQVLEQTIEDKKQEAIDEVILKASAIINQSISSLEEVIKEDRIFKIEQTVATLTLICEENGARLLQIEEQTPRGKKDPSVRISLGQLYGQNVSSTNSLEIFEAKKVEGNTSYVESKVSQQNKIQDVLNSIKLINDQELQSELNEESQEESDGIELEQPKSVIDVLDSGNFYQSDENNSAFKEEQLQIDDYFNIDMNVPKVQLKDQREESAIEEFIMSEILEAFKIHQLNL